MQETSIMNFCFQGGPIRVVGDADSPKFVGADVCRLLGYENPSRTMSLHCKGVPEWYTLDTGGGPQKLRVISESDLMRLICGSKRPEAAQFESWVFEEVLPSVRKHGAYMTPATIENLVTNPDLVIELATKLKEEQERCRTLREANNEARRRLSIADQDILKKNTEIEVMKPKAEFADKFCRADDCILVRDFAKHVAQALGIHFSQKDAFKWLISNKHMNKNHYPSSVAVANGWLWVKEGLREHRDGSPAITHTTKVTAEGQVYFFNKIKEQHTKGKL